MLSRIRELALSSVDKETGGILVGANVGKDIRVSGASDPGPNADRSPTHFLRDTEYCRQFLETRYKESGADYVGEWHTHVVALHRLRHRRPRYFSRDIVDPDYDFESFAVILVILREGEAELLVYTAERKQGRRTHLEITEIYRGPFPGGEEAPAKQARE